MVLRLLRRCLTKVGMMWRLLMELRHRRTLRLADDRRLGGQLLGDGGFDLEAWRFVRLEVLHLPMDGLQQLWLLVMMVLLLRLQLLLLLKVHMVGRLRKGEAMLMLLHIVENVRLLDGREKLTTIGELGCLHRLYMANNATNKKKQLLLSHISL